MTDLDVLEELQRVVDLAGVPCRNVLPLAQVGAYGEEYRVESTLGLLVHEIRHVVVQDDLDAGSADAIDLPVQHRARQSVLRNAEVHHAARHRAGFMNDDLVAPERQVPGH